MTSKGWSEHAGLAVAMPAENIDTDQIIPARFMSRTRAEGYGDVLFNDLKNTTHGSSDNEFILDHHPEASILVTGRNFGSGSSREAAVYALVDAGFKAVIAPGFGDIFAANAVNNGLLPAQLCTTDHEQLLHIMRNAAMALQISLEHRTISAGQQALSFALNDSWREKLINGWDDIDITRTHQPAITHFSLTRRRLAPWSWPQGMSRE